MFQILPPSRMPSKPGARPFEFFDADDGTPRRLLMGAVTDILKVLFHIIMHHTDENLVGLLLLKGSHQSSRRIRNEIQKGQWHPQ